MSDSDTNDSVWKSERVIQEWAASANTREAKHGERWAIMARLLPFAQDEEFTFLDLGAGTGAAARTVLATFPRARAILADYSEQMIGEASNSMAAYADRYEYVVFDMLQNAWPVTIPANLDAIVTSLAIHHVPDERKRGLFREIFDHLRPGGWYLNYDPVTSEDASITATWERVTDRDDPAGIHERLHPTSEQQARHENHVRYMIPLEPQIGFLREAGFSGIDVFWKYMENTIYGGYKAR